MQWPGFDVLYSQSRLKWHKLLSYHLDQKRIFHVSFTLAYISHPDTSLQERQPTWATTSDDSLSRALQTIL